MKQLDTVISNIVGDGRLLTVQPGGNHGDTLIYKGFNKYISGTDIDTIPLNQGTPRRDSPYKFPSLNLRRNAKTLLLNVKYLKKAFRDNISAVYMHGGAGFSDFWEAGIDCYTTIARYFDCPIIIGPSTCQFNTTNPTHIFNNVDNETHFFAVRNILIKILKMRQRSVTMFRSISKTILPYFLTRKICRLTNLMIDIHYLECVRTNLRQAR